MITRNTIFLVSIFTSFFSISQQTVCLGDDATVCSPGSITIEDCGGYGTGSYITTTPYVQESIPYAPEPFDQGTSVDLSDDDVSNAIPIGFDFCFFGDEYNELYIGSNGWVSFSAGQPTTFTSEVIPDQANNVPKNCIMAPWQDYHPGTGPNVGNYIYYNSYGTAPNRRFVISYNDIPFFFCTNTYNSIQIVLFESTNVIETQIREKNNCPSWAQGTATHGVHNIDGTIAFVVPGRNSTQWTASNEGTRFTPGIQLEWASTDGQTFPYNGGVLNIANVQNDTIGYYLKSVTCNEPTTPSDTTWIYGTSVSSVISASSNDVCSDGIGEATVDAIGGTAPYSYQWDDPMNQTTATATNLTQGSYNVTITDASGCQSTSTVNIDDTPISLSTNYTQVSCPGGSDGTATVDVTPVPTTVSYDWYDAGGQTTQTATGLTAGTYHVAVETGVGCQDTAEVIVDEIPGMIVDLVNTTDATCNSGSDGVATVEVTQGTSPYTYSWQNSASTTVSADDLPAGTHTVTVTDANGCVVDLDVTIGEPSPLQIDVIAPDTVVCDGDSAVVYATGSGGSSPYTFTWTQNGNVIGTGDTLGVLPPGNNTQYCVTLSEQCGSPETQECMSITYPEAFTPMISPDITGACFPVEVTFQNTTNTTEDIDYTVWDYGDGTIDTINSLDQSTHEFGEGLFDISVEVVTESGCSFYNTFNDLIHGYPYPKAAFYVNPNPASVFEPEVDAFSQSGNDIITYQWIADGADPSFSSIQDPTFVYPNEVENHDVTLIVENSYGCLDTTTRIVRIQNEVLLYAPNTFTPDGDELNQNWRVFIQGVDIYNFDLEIYNRWGEIIWESHDPDASWDGTYNGQLVKDGTYIWKIRAFDQENDNKYEFNGFVNVIR